MTHLRRFEIERYLTGDLDAGERRTVDAHLSACESCRAAIEETRARFDAWSAARPPLRLTAPDALSAPPTTESAPARERAPQVRRRRMAPLAAGALAVAAALALVFLPQNGTPPEAPSDERLKGIVVAVHLLRDGAPRPLGIDDRVRDGDRIRFEITSDRDAHVAVVAATPGGEAELWYPDAEEDLPEVHAAEATLLAGSIELSEMVERHEVYVVLVEPPIEREALLDAARDAARTGSTRLDVPNVGHWHRTLMPE